MQKKSGFTLIELLIVIAVIGILASIIAPKLFGAMTGAKEQHCRNNLRQLQSAVVDFASDRNGDLPYAQSYEVYQVGDGTYHERRGWVSWVPSDRDIATLDSLWGDDPHNSHSSELRDDLGCGEDAAFAIEYGTLFDYVGDPKSYYCPVTERNPKKWIQVLTRTEGNHTNAPVVRRTYAMNPFFGAPTVILLLEEREREERQDLLVSPGGGQAPALHGDLPGRAGSFGEPFRRQRPGAGRPAQSRLLRQSEGLRFLLRIRHGPPRRGQAGIGP